MLKNVLKILLVVLMLLFCIAAYPVQDQPKKCDLQFSLSGGNIGGKFSLVGDFLYAQAFGELFVQAAGFANLGQTKEYGGSFGLGSFSDTGDLYLFIDSLYSYGKLWTQLRPTARLRFSWMSLTAFYAFPITKSTIQVGDERVGATNYWGGELNLVPISWARLYGNLISVNGICTYKFGTEVRPIKWLSISADWNKTDSGIYSKWNSYQDVRVALNFLLGSQRQSFKLNQRIQMQPMYPILVQKKSEPPPFVKGKAIVEFLYERVLPIIRPNEPDPGRFAFLDNPHYQDVPLGNFRKIADNQWMCEATIQDDGDYIFAVYDMKVVTIYSSVGKKVSARIQGTEQWREQTRIVPNSRGLGEAVNVNLKDLKL